MKKVYLHIRQTIMPGVIILAMIYGCGKTAEFVLTDPDTGLPPVTLTTANGDCRVTKIAQKNNGGTSADHAFAIQRDASLLPVNISSYDSLQKKSEYNISIQVSGDTTRLSTGEYLVTDKITKQVNFFYTLADLSDPASDKQLYQYLYDAAGYLVKKYCYINGAANPTYESNYTYDNNKLLTGCVMYAGSRRDKLLESVLDYDLTTARKAWLYLFPDFFESYRYLQAFNFGNRGTYPVKNISTKIYDITNGAELDAWVTAFSGYVYSQDNFILQTSAKGDLQQGLGLLFGTTRFDYQCTK